MALNSKQLKAIPALIASDTVEGAARKTGIAKTTIYKWMKQEQFSRAIASARHKVLDKAMCKLVNVSMKAVLTLEKLLTAKSEAVRRAAANDILANSLKYREITEFEDRLESVEKIIMERRIYRNV